MGDLDMLVKDVARIEPRMYHRLEQVSSCKNEDRPLTSEMCRGQAEGRHWGCGAKLDHSHPEHGCIVTPKQSVYIERRRIMPYVLDHGIVWKHGKVAGFDEFQFHPRTRVHAYTPSVRLAN
jgi:hypothetical protein